MHEATLDMHLKLMLRFRGSGRDQRSRPRLDL